MIGMMALMLAAAADPQMGTLVQAAQGFDDAQFHHDRAAVNRFLAPDFQYVTRAGKLLGRKEFIANTTSPTEKLEPLVIHDHRVEPLGTGGGVASGDAIVRGAQAGKPFTDRFRYADVFARRGGKWVVVYTQVTALPKP